MSVAPERLAADDVERRIAQACERSGRDPASVTLVAATKTVEPERIRACGVRDAGENRAQELAAKQESLAGEPIRWHFIGALQRNKVRVVVGGVVLVHGVDSVALAEEIGRRAEAAGLVQDVLIEVNRSGEASKAGIAPADLPALLAAARPIDGIRVRGLMTIPAPGSTGASREAFRGLARLAADHGLPELSMGMSGDFEIAVEEGATLVRVGTAIFGARAR